MEKNMADIFAALGIQSLRERIESYNRRSERDRKIIRTFNQLVDCCRFDRETFLMLQDIVDQQLDES